MNEEYNCLGYCMYTSQKLKLQNKWALLAPPPRQKGGTDLVCSSNISVGDALLKAKNTRRYKFILYK